MAPSNRCSVGDSVERLDTLPVDEVRARAAEIAAAYAKVEEAQAPKALLVLRSLRQVEKGDGQEPA